MSSTTHQSRLTYIDLLKGFGIFLVVWGHTMVPRSAYIYSFHMPFFFFLSGFIHKQKPLNQFILNKINTLYVPYVIFTVFSWLFYLIRMILKDNTALIDDHLSKLSSIFTGNADNGGNNPLWFLTCLLVISVLFLFIQKFFTHRKGLPFVILISSFIGYRLSVYNISFHFNIDIAFTGLTFYYLGFLAKERNCLLLIKKLKPSIILLLLSLIEALHIVTAHLNIELSGISHVNMAGNVLGNYFLFYLSACCGIIFFMIVGFKVQSVNFLNYLGLNTLTVLAAHKPVLILINDLANDYINTQTNLYGFYASIMAILLIIPLIWLIDKYLPYIIGKKPLITLSHLRHSGFDHSSVTSR